MRLTLATFITLDGVVQAPGGPDEDPSRDFDLGGWFVPYVDDDLLQVVTGWIAEADAFLMGRKTYEIFAGSWPLITDPDDAVAAAFNSLPKYVASRTLKEVPWNGAQLLQGDVVAAIADVKNLPGRELHIPGGSGNLAQSLIAHDIIDEYRLVTAPVVLGKGKRLFGDGARPAALKHTEHRSTRAGLNIDVYVPAGAPTFGAIGPEVDTNAKP
jgi:dihydrofolate reductase